jgi:hypothetical protein
MSDSDRCAAAVELSKAVAGIDAKLGSLLARRAEEREEFRDEMRMLAAWRQAESNRITKVEADLGKLSTTIEGSNREADIGLMKRVVALESSQTSTRAILGFVKGLAIVYVPLAGIVAAIAGWISSIVAHAVAGK